jgi:hypothetical protein
MIAKRTTHKNKRVIPPLYNGDRLTQREFHRRYEAMPEDFKAELIGGTVYVPSPLGWVHAFQQPELNGVFWLYKSQTPGVEVLDNATIILGPESEPQPDSGLCIRAECGGRSHTRGKYIVGPPELIGEIAHSSEAIDLGPKKTDYAVAGVMEYIVVCLREKELRWFDLQAETELVADQHGIYRSMVFPGLWLDSNALIKRDSPRLLEVIQQGVASPEHAAFVRRLLAARRKQK